MKIKSAIFLLIFYSLIFISSLSFLDTLSYLSSPIVKSIIHNKNISLLNFDKDNNDNYLSSENNDSSEYNESISWRGRLFTILRNEIESLNISKSNASQSCINVFNKYLFGHNDPNNSSNISYLRSDYHIVKFLDDSSKTRNFLGAYDQCMYKIYNFQLEDILNKHITKSTFVVFLFDKTKQHDILSQITPNLTYIDLEFYYYVFGLCLPQGINDGEYCSDEDYKKLVSYINLEIGDYLGFANASVSTFSLRTNPIDLEKDSTFSIILCLLPFLFFLLQAFFVVFRNVFIYLFETKCFKESKNKNIINEVEENRNEYSIDEGSDNEDERISDARIKENMLSEKIENNQKLKIIKKIVDCFCFTENEKELFNFSLTSTKYNNDSGISNVRGIIGINIFLMIFGWTFVALVNSPVKLYSPNYFQQFIDSGISSIIMMGVRYAPRIIISCSGYILTYKYISYLDRKVIDNSIGIFRTCLTFIIYQSHKYILLILLLLFERFSLYRIFNLFLPIRPIWKFFHLNILRKPRIEIFLWSLTMLEYFYPNKEEDNRNGLNLLNYYWLPFNEIFFFIFGVLLITIGFKKKYRIDLFILILIPLWFIIKIAYSYLINIYLKDNDLPFKGLIPVYYYIFFNYGRFMTNPVFNLPYFLIGMYFGLMNYTIQKGIININKLNIYSKYNSENDKEEIDENSEDNIDSYQDINPNTNKKKYQGKENENKDYCSEVIKMPFLISPITFVQWHRKKNIKYLSILLIIFALISIFIFVIYFHFSNILKKSNPYSFINLIFRIDIEIIILFIQWGAFIIFLKADNFAAIFLSHLAWTMLTKPYFSFILIINTALLFIFYQSETVLEINLVNILLYSVIGGVLTFIFTSLFYIFFELPYKRLIHLIISFINEKKENDDINNELKDYDDDSCNDDSNIDLQDKDIKEKNE